MVLDKKRKKIRINGFKSPSWLYFITNRKIQFKIESCFTSTVYFVSSFRLSINICKRKVDSLPLILHLQIKIHVLLHMCSAWYNLSVCIFSVHLLSVLFMVFLVTSLVSPIYGVSGYQFGIFYLRCFWLPVWYLQTFLGCAQV
jgi:hypothetical protein